MKGAVIHGARDVRFETRADPTIIEPSDAIIRLPVTCICGSDLWPYRGVNPVTQFRAVVSCQTIVGGVANVTNVPTGLVPASGTGDAEIDTSVSLPEPCFAPIVFVTSPGNAWFAVTGR